jgi:hypothetical protein
MKSQLRKAGCILKESNRRSEHGQVRKLRDLHGKTCIVISRWYSFSFCVDVRQQGE